jgi:hypothetical protein
MSTFFLHQISFSNQKESAVHHHHTAARHDEAVIHHDKSRRPRQLEPLELNITQ